MDDSVEKIMSLKIEDVKTQKKEKSLFGQLDPVMRPEERIAVAGEGGAVREENLFSSNSSNSSTEDKAKNKKPSVKVDSLFGDDDEEDDDDGLFSTPAPAKAAKAAKAAKPETKQSEKAATVSKPEQTNKQEVKFEADTEEKKPISEVLQAAKAEPSKPAPPAATGSSRPKSARIAALQQGMAFNPAMLMGGAPGARGSTGSKRDSAESNDPLADIMNGSASAVSKGEKDVEPSEEEKKELTHLTASRAKSGPKRRPPKRAGRQVNASLCFIGCSNTFCVADRPKRFQGRGDG